MSQDGGWARVVHIARKVRILAEKPGVKGVIRSTLMISRERLLSISEAKVATSVETGVSWRVCSGPVMKM